MIQIEHPYPSAKMLQCSEVISHAGELAANTFAAGGRTITFQLGHYIGDEFRYGHNEVNDNVTLKAFCDADPTQGRLPGEFDPFVNTNWPGVDKEGKAMTIGQVLTGVMSLPLLPGVAVGTILVRQSPFDSYYAIRNRVASMMGLVMKKGGLQLGVSLYRLAEEQEQRLQESEEVFTEQIRTKDKEGKDVFTPRQNTRSKQNMVPVSVTPVVLVFDIDKNLVMSADEIGSVQGYESTYNPSWGLVEMLHGKFKNEDPFHRGEMS